MKVYRKHDYSLYIITNPERTVLYTGVTNDLGQRLIEHWNNRGNPKTFAGKYFCFNLIYFEDFQYINDAIAREKQIKGWSRKKNRFNKDDEPGVEFSRCFDLDGWPPKKIPTRF